MRVQLIASARHAIDSRDASLLPMGIDTVQYLCYGHVCAYNHMTWRPLRLYYLRFHVKLLYCWCCCGLFYYYVERTEHLESPRKEDSCVDGAGPCHSIEFALDISLAPTRLQRPLSPRSSSQKTFSYPACKASARHAIDSIVDTRLYYLWACYVRTVT